MAINRSKPLLKPLLYLSLIAFTLISDLTLIDAQAQHYRGRCGSPPREPHCITNRNMDDRRIQDCQRQLQDYGRHVDRFAKCLNNEGSQKEREAQKLVDEVQSIRTAQQAIASATQDANRKFSCALSGKSYCR
ncbi:MAG: hypothetical protein PVF65_00910 [Sphingomonadales bacterium]|jgi:hypothetical protein